MQDPVSYHSDKAGKGQWTPTVCYMCYSNCGIRVRTADGIIVEIVGDPDNPHNQGKLCAKGKAGFLSLYDPHRVLRPLKRRNPVKGIGVDPQWEEVSWEEALEIIVEKLKKIREEDPKKLVISGLDYQTSPFDTAFGAAFGTPNWWPGAPGYFCGNAVHPILFITNGTFYAEPDFNYCNYLLLIGSQLGFMLGPNSNTNARRMAEARARGMKVVVVDPVLSPAAAKADEWIPIRPGTDGAFALGILNHLVNVMGCYDAKFLKDYTNGSYLIKPDGYYLRDGVSNKPLVWDCSRQEARPYDDLGIREPALEGIFTLEGVPCRPAFQLLKEQIKKYELEKVSQTTTVPVSTLLQVATEFGQAARLGSHIVFQGMELPYRPVAVHWNKGVSSHRHAVLTGMAVQLMNIAVGAIDIPGGSLGTNPVGPFWAPTEGPDGFLVPARIQLLAQGVFPPHEVGPPESLLMEELVPVGNSRVMFEEAILNPARYRFSYRAEVMLNRESNPMMSASHPERMAAVLKGIPFLVAFALQMDETVEFADLVLPEAHYLERWVPLANRAGATIASGPGDWYWMFQQPVLSPAGEAKSSSEVLLEIADRLGILGDFHVVLNTRLYLKEPYKIQPDKKYSLEDIADICARSWFGPEFALPWFRDHGFLISGKKRVEEAYSRAFIKPRLPIYLEYYKRIGKEIEETTREMGLSWDTSDYQPLPDWKPCPGFMEDPSEYPLYAVNFRWPFHTFSFTVLNPWLNELAEWHPMAYKILINTKVAAHHGIADGDWVWVESSGGKVKAQAKVTEGVHPEVVGIPGTFGHWATALSVGTGKGAHFNQLFGQDNSKLVDPLSGALDCCLRVKIYKAMA